MALLVTKFKYLKKGSNEKAGRFVKYIGTRAGVEKIDDTQGLRPATVKQKELIQSILKDFPDSKEMHEYEDYVSNPTISNASEFITRSLEDNAFEIEDSKTYADYIATRPRVEKNGKHGLFSDEDKPIELAKVSRELKEYDGNVWTVIISLRREDAERFGYDNGKQWRDMLRSQSANLANALNIPLANLNWYGAFHNESYHPHVHLIVYSKESGQGYLTKKGVMDLRSAYANDIFAQELIGIYKEQTKHRDELRSVSRALVNQIVGEINSGVFSNPELEDKMIRLAGMLSRTNRTKKYGYLPPYIKDLVNSIVDDIASDERISKLYELWYEQRENITKTYSDELPERVPLSQNDTFKPIKNAVINEAMNIVENRLTEEEPIEPTENQDMPINDDVEFEEPIHLTDRERKTEMWRLYRQAKELLDNESEQYNPDRAVELLTESAELGNDIAKYKLGRMYLFGEHVPKNLSVGMLWLEEAVENGNDFAEYLLGKVLLHSEDIEQDIERGEKLLRSSASKNNRFAQYLLGKELINGDTLLSNTEEGFRLLYRSAEQEFSVAQYLLGKLLYQGVAIDKDLPKAIEYLERATWKGNEYAAYLAGKIRLFEADVKDVRKAIWNLRIAAEKENSYAELMLAKLYLYGKEVPRDYNTAMLYLHSSAEHGNVYAQQLIDSLNSNRNWSAAMGTLRLLHHIGRTIRNQLENERKNKGGAIDRKHKRQIDEKKQAHGLKQG